MKAILADAGNDTDDDASAPEGGALYRRHRMRERNRGPREEDLRIECHHAVPVHTAGQGMTKLSGSALICSNYDRMILGIAP
ncbi:hypothetical protein [Streptomyces sp. NPDC127072]|uniref:hypothetical protein n=1 Tax=Streptomyces sp. NPDC127072 TaxID=3347129 RepID=UPI00364EC3D3